MRASPRPVPAAMSARVPAHAGRRRRRPRTTPAPSWSHRCRRPGASRSGAVDLHDGFEELERFGAPALERVAPDDRAEAAALADGAHLVEHRLVLLLERAAGEDDDATAVERGLHDVAHALGQRPGGHLLLRVDLLGRL